MSRKVLIPLAIALLAVLIMTWHSAALPATVVIINASGSPIANVAVLSGYKRVDIGPMNNSETRRVSIPSGSIVSFSFHGLGDKKWETGEPLTAGRTIVLY